jgi:hypothetical protein
MPHDVAKKPPNPTGARECNTDRCPRIHVGDDSGLAPKSATFGWRMSRAVAQPETRTLDRSRGPRTKRGCDRESSGCRVRACTRSISPAPCKKCTRRRRRRGGHEKMRARSISASVVNRPTLRRTAPRPSSGETPIAASTGERLTRPSWHAEPVEAAISGTASSNSAPTPPRRRDRSAWSRCRRGRWASRSR